MAANKGPFAGARKTGFTIGRRLPLFKRKSQAPNPNASWWKPRLGSLSDLWKRKEGDPDQGDLIDLVRGRKKPADEEREEAQQEQRDYDEELLEEENERGKQQEALLETQLQAQIDQCDQEAEKALEGHPGNIRYFIAFIIACLNYASNLIAIGLVPGAGDVIDAVTEVLYFFILGSSGFLPAIVGAAEFIPGADFFPIHVLGVCIAWYGAHKYHNEAQKWRKKKEELQEKVKKAKDGKTGNKYRPPNTAWTAILLAIVVGTLILGLLGFFPLSRTLLIVFVVGPIALLLLSSLDLPLLPRPSWNQDLWIFLLRWAAIIGLIVFVIIYLLPTFIGCIRSGECQELLAEGFLQSQIRIGHPVDALTNWYKHQLQTAGFQLEGKAENQKIGCHILSMSTRLPRGGVLHEGEPVTVYSKLLCTLYYPTEIQHHCTLSMASINSKGVTKIIGKADEIDPETTNVYETKEETVSCTWNNLKKGTYRATYTGSLYSTTNAFVTLTFAERDTLQSFRTHEPDTDINKLLHIDPVFKPLYTNGPITVQVDRITQPIALNLDETTRTIPLNLFLESNWTDGKIEHADSITLYVPQEMELQPRTGCEGFEKKTSSIQEYDEYTLPYNRLGNARETLQRLTCNLLIPDARKLMKDKPKALKTIALEIKYKYKIQKETTFSVRT